jgi:hypothetical protein
VPTKRGICTPLDQSQNEGYLLFVRETREISSAGSEHLVYTEGVGGSNPAFPTKALEKSRAFFVCSIFGIDPTLGQNNFPPKPKINLGFFHKAIHKNGNRPFIHGINIMCMWF